MRALVVAACLVTLASACGSSSTSPAVRSPSSSISAAVPSTTPASPAPATPSSAAASTPSIAPVPSSPPPTAKPTPAPTPQVPAATPATRPPTGFDSYDHVFLVVFENKGYTQIVGNPAAPSFNRLIKAGALSTHYSAVAHPSLPNYLAMLGGSTFGITTDCAPATCPVKASSLASVLSAHGRSWKAYMESMPRSCGTVSTSSYAVKHDPFVYFDPIRTTARCGQVVPLTELATDLRSEATTPRFAFVTPNICNDLHDCPIATGDAWLGRFAATVMASPAWTSRRSLLIATFDEDDGAERNHVLTFAIGSPVRTSVRPGSHSEVAYDHYDLLRTLEHYLGVPTLGRHDADATVMTVLIPN